MSIHDEEEESEQQQPEWAFSLWDMFGVLFYTIAEVLAALSKGCSALTREFVAAANHSRTRRLVKAHQKTEERNRREMAEHLKDSVYMIPEDQ